MHQTLSLLSSQPFLTAVSGALLRFPTADTASSKLAGAHGLHVRPRVGAQGAGRREGGASAPEKQTDQISPGLTQAR